MYVERIDGKYVAKILSNGHSTANLSNLSTRRKFAIFGEFEYSPKWTFLKIGRTCQTRRHSPTWFAPTCQTRRHSQTWFAWTCQTSERQVWRVLRKFSEFGEFGEFSECRLDRFIHIQYVFCVYNNLSCLCQHSSRGLASTRQTRRHSPTWFARTRQTR